MKFSIPPRRLLTLIVLLVIAVAILLNVFFGRPRSVNAQGNTNPWQDIPLAVLNGVPGARVINPLQYRSLRLDRASIALLLNQAPLERTPEAETRPLLLPVPYPDGSFKFFRVVESPVMEPALAAKFPEIKTYSGNSPEDPTATARFDLTPQGFHAIVLSAKPTIYIDPVIKGNADYYVSYNKTDFRKADWSWQCDARGTPPAKAVSALNEPFVSNGAMLLTYRLACAATGEYTAFHGGTVAGGLAAMTTSINRVSAVYERDLAVRMVLVANNNLVIYTNSATDPYTNNNGFTMLNQNQANLDSVIGTANYDIGHVFSTGGGGVATLASVCEDNFKARGVTGSSAPVGDPFDIDYVAHEMGHQFGADHTFNGTTGSCAGGNRAPSAAYEPGSGTTIMAYAGICGAENLQANSDDHFHVKSLEEIVAFITTSGGGCATPTNTSNLLPTVNAGSAFTIPRQTPFTLTATGNDPDGAGLTYCWEQYNLGAASPPNTDDGTRPIFRSFSPTTNAARTFPKLSDILNNTTTIGESLPTTTRTLTFQVTARDNRANGGAIQTSTVNIQSTATAGPFVVTSPNTLINWPGNSLQVVTWNVANTSTSPVNCANVKITLSTDGGQTFPTVLAESTPNTGTANVTAPNLVTTQARVRVQAVSNIFFDLSNVNFNIGAACPTITVSPASLPGGTMGMMYNQTVSAAGGTGPYTFAITSGAQPTNLTLAPNGLLSGTPTANGTFTFNVTATDANGCTGLQSYSISIAGCPTITLSPTSLPGTTIGTPYSQMISATGGTAPYTFAITIGAPPTGLTLAVNGLLSGTPTANGTFNFTATAIATGGCTGTQSYSITIIAGGGTLTANPNPVSLCNGATSGVTTLNWTAPAGVTATRIHVNSPAGTLFAAGGASGSATTGSWVSNGMQFFLINAANGTVLAFTTVTTTTSGCSTGTLTATPNPIQICDGTGLGITTLSWNAPGVTTVQLRVTSPTGPLFTQGGSSGSQSTGKWVTNGMQFFLVNAANGATLASTTVNTTTTGCASGGTLTAAPNPIQVCDGTGLGVTTLTWNAPGIASTRLHVGSPVGPLFTSGGSTGSATTGKWVTNGMQFFLVNAANNATLATATAALTTVGCTGGPLIANPNPIQVCNGSGLGMTTLQWTAPAGVTAIQIRVGSANGALFAQGGPTGSQPTGLWVSNGMQFFLQDISGGAPGTTLGTVTVSHTNAGCPSSIALQR